MTTGPEVRPDGGDLLWSWQCREPDGRWSMISMGLTPEAQLPMVHRDYQFMITLQEFAEEHMRRTGQTIRLALFKLVDYDILEPT